jgi:hypothetical protein
MAYSQLTTRTTSDANAAADINQLQANIEALKGGAGSAAPVTTLAEAGAVDVDGVTKKLLWKVITGTTPAATTMSVAHGLADKNKIVTLQIYIDAVDLYNSPALASFFRGQFDAAPYYYYFLEAVDDTNIRDIGTDAQGKFYSIGISYYE